MKRKTKAEIEETVHQARLRRKKVLKKKKKAFLAKGDIYSMHYHNGAKSITFNDNDPDLHPIVVDLPEIPERETIEGWGQSVYNQVFKRHSETDPESWKVLMWIQNNFDTVEQCIAELRMNKDKYAKEIAFIQLDHKRFREGYWFYNNGTPTYITGAHYRYLNYWHAGAKYPKYRSRDRKFFIFAEFVDNDPFACGFNYPKFRREGATSKTACLIYHIITMERSVHGGIQSKDDSSAAKVFTKHVVQNWKKLTFWQKPIHEGRSEPKQTLNFFPQSKDVGNKGTSAGFADSLESWIDFGPSTEGHFDGDKLRFHYGDEVGKCFKINTLVRMFDGSVKKVQDIKSGEFVMGDDSTPRTVLSTTSGSETMYDIIPNKGKTWGCNESHILSLRWCSSRPDRGWEKDQIINISVKDYLLLPERAKKHLMQWRTGVQYKASPHYLDPYILGVWLGDGSQSELSITNADKEVGEAIKKYCDDIDVKYGITPNIKSNTWVHRIFIQGAAGNKLREELKSLDILNNKHVPQSYIIDSEENRLRLLAGLIDTDGHRDKRVGNKMCYEIVQKRKHVAESIVEVATSLGFYASIVKKEATMKRPDGSIYRCDVYRVTIFGDLYKIPCRVERKKYKKIKAHHKNRKNPLRSGFEIKETGIDRYYGFALDGNHLFLLDDFTVVHNSKECDVYQRHLVIKPCVTEGNKYIGLIVNTSTVGDMDKGGGNHFKMLCSGSHYQKRNDNNETSTGLYNMFIPSYDGFALEDKTTGKEFIDKYGNSNLKATKEFLENRRKALRESGDMDGLAEEIRQFPFTFAECFRGGSIGCNFNINIINDRLDTFRFGNPHIVEGNFMWKDGEKDTKVIWQPAKGGRFRVSYLLPSGQDNKHSWVGDVKVPGNKRLGCAGGDPFKFDDVVSNKKSDGAGAVYMRYDASIDDPTGDPEKWVTDRFICTYSNRPRTKELYGEDMLMMCLYYGIEMYPEVNVSFLWDYFRDRGYGGYLYYKQDSASGRFSKTPGATTTKKVQEDIYGEYYSYIERCGHREVHNEILQQCLDIEDDMSPFDLFVAGGYALMGCRRQVATENKNSEKHTFHKKRKYA